MRKRLSRAVLLSSAAALLGCAASEKYFRPTEHVQGENWRGFRAAQYEVRFAAGRAGEVSVWSPGAFKSDDDRTIIRIGFEVANSSSVPLTLTPDSVRLDVISKEGEFADLPSLRLAGGTTVAPGGVGDVTVDFVVPNQVRAGDVSSYRVRWQVESEGQRFVQATPFKQVPARSYSYYPYGYYDPYFYPYYPAYYPYRFYDPFWSPPLPGFHFGVGFGVRRHHLHPHH